MTKIKTAAEAASVIALSFLAMRGVAASISLDTYKVSPSTNLYLPALPTDSAEASKNAFNNDLLLNAVNSKLSGVAKDWQLMKADTASTLHFSKAEKGVELRTIATRLRPSSYVTGKLRLKSNVIANLKNGSNTLLTASSADSVATWLDTPFTFEPERTADLYVTFVSLADDPADPEIALEFVPDEGFEKVSFAQGPDITKRFLIEETALGTRLYRTSISPDGKYIILSYYTTYGKDSSRYWAELQETATGKTLNASLPYGAYWMDKGSTLAFTVKTDATYSLYTMDAASQKQTLLAKDLPDNSFVISPDASYLIFHDLVEGSKDNGPLLRLQDPDDRLSGHRDRYYLQKYDLKTGITQPLTYAGNTTYLSDISPDSKKIVFTTTTEMPDTYPFYFNDVIEMDINTLATDTLVRHDPYVRSCTYSPDGKQLFITAGPEAFGGAGKNNGGHKYSNEYDLQGFILTIADKAVDPMTRDFNPTIEDEPVWNRADGNIYFRASDGFDLNVYCMNPKTGSIQKLSLDIPYTTTFSIGSDEAKWLSCTGGDYSYTGKGELLDLKSGKIRLLDDPYSRDFADLQVGDASNWTFKASDGTTIDCMQILPPDFDPSKKYPMIVYYYGGCTPSQKAVSVYDPHTFASRGYVTLVINPSGAYGYGQEFSARHANAWGKRTAEDIIEGVKEYCATHDFVNPDKIGCLGASYGGFMTQYLQTLTDIFAAAVSHAGISNVTSYWGEGNWGYSYNTVAAPESYPWNNPDLFTQQGSLFNADKIHTPLLLMHGNADTNVPIGESIQLFNALRILGRDVEFIQVDGENHYIADYEKRKLWMNAIMAWFAKYLQDSPEWWNNTIRN
ncbi:MAG: prolyl oligopeptidase family serine peptidase [Muribaculum sp.]|nr:prolyl oligopeptidase family serine peptidase [Muribaculum sp.]